jgi:hypothetical protein
MIWPQEDTDKIPLWRLTAEQRQKVYEEEKERMERSRPLLSMKTRAVAGVYLVGCRFAGWIMFI